MRESSLGVGRLGRLFGGLVCALKEMVITVSFVTLGHFSKIGFLKLAFFQHSKRSHHVHNHLNILY